MPYDPAKPAFGSPDSSAERRARAEASACLHALNALFSALQLAEDPLAR
jgi:hypothetical protein